MMANLAMMKAMLVCLIALAVSDDAGFSGGLATPGSFSMVGSSWEEERSKARTQLAATNELGECLQSKEDDTSEVAPALIKGAAASRAAKALKAKASAWDGKAEATLAKARRQIQKFQKLGEASRAKAAKLERTAAAQIKTKRSQQTRQKATLDGAMDLLQTKGKLTLADAPGPAAQRDLGASGNNNRRRKDGAPAPAPAPAPKSKESKEERTAMRAKRKGKADSATKNQEQQNMVNGELKKAFQALLSKVDPSYPIPKQTIDVASDDAPPASEEELGEAMEAEAGGDGACSRANRPSGQTYTLCMERIKWTVFEAQIRAASGESGPYKAGTTAKGVHPTKKCSSAGCKKNSKGDLVCGTVLSPGAGSKKCACAKKSDEAMLGIRDWAQAATLGEGTGRRRKEKKARRPGKGGLDSGAAINYPVQAACEQTYKWPSYKYVSNDTNSTAPASNTTTLIPQFGDCSCIATKKATCVLSAPPTDDGIPGITCELEKKIANCGGGSASAGMDDTALAAHVNTWCESGFVGI